MCVCLNATVPIEDLGPTFGHFDVFAVVVAVVDVVVVGGGLFVVVG